MSSPPELLGVRGIGRFCNVSQTTANKWRKRDDFPKPAAIVDGRPAWRAEDVQQWAAEHLPLPTGKRRKRP